MNFGSWDKCDCQLPWLERLSQGSPCTARVSLPREDLNDKRWGNQYAGYEYRVCWWKKDSTRSSHFIPARNWAPHSGGKELGSSESPLAQPAGLLSLGLELQPDYPQHIGRPLGWHPGPPLCQPYVGRDANLCCWEVHLAGLLWVPFCGVPYLSFPGIIPALCFQT